MPIYRHSIIFFRYIADPYPGPTNPLIGDAIACKNSQRAKKNKLFTKGNGINFDNTDNHKGHLCSKEGLFC